MKTPEVKTPEWTEFMDGLRRHMGGVLAEMDTTATLEEENRCAEIMRTCSEVYKNVGLTHAALIDAVAPMTPTETTEGTANEQKEQWKIT